MSNAAVARNDDELEKIRSIASSGNDGPVLMLNLNRYVADAMYPHGELYRSYRRALDAVLPVVGAKIAWQSPAHGQIVGDQPIDEILAVWYPSHQAFLDLPNAPGAENNYRLRAQCVEYAVIHRCDADQLQTMA
jgi:hypothetical protein